MQIDGTWLFLSLIPSSAGFLLIVYGKKQGRWPHALAGVLLTIYPYFTTSVAALVGVGAAIGAGLFMAVRAGW